MTAEMSVPHNVFARMYKQEGLKSLLPAQVYRKLNQLFHWYESASLAASRKDRLVVITE
jgi:hypothetical protein